MWWLVCRIVTPRFGGSPDDDAGKLCSGGHPHLSLILFTTTLPVTFVLVVLYTSRYSDIREHRYAMSRKEVGVAGLRMEGDELVLRLSTLEKAEGMHGDLRVPLASVKSVEVLDDAHAPADVGFKFGTRLPGTVEVGTFTKRGHKVFAVVHRNTPRGVRVHLEGAAHDEWIVGCADPEAVAAAISVPS